MLTAVTDYCSCVLPITMPLPLPADRLRSLPACSAILRYTGTICWTAVDWSIDCLLHYLFLPLHYSILLLLFQNKHHLGC